MTIPVRIEPLEVGDRPTAVTMLGEDRDLPRSVPESYSKSHGWDRDWVAWMGDRMVGLVTGGFGDFSDRSAFEHFDLPAGPHAFLYRVFVRPAVRDNGVGPQLLNYFMHEAVGRRCTFVVGYLDRNGYVRERRRFFERMGFSIGPDDTFGAQPEAVLDAVAMDHR